MKTAVLIVRVLLGLGFMVFGANIFISVFAATTVSARIRPRCSS